jgi:GNAT superfamily N-acetyltransferase
MKIPREELFFESLDYTSHQKMIQGFYCGNDLIDNYIKTDYLSEYNHSFGLASTQLVTYKDELVAFVTSRCTQVKIEEDEAKEIGTEVFYVPALEIMYLAVDKRFQQRGVGESLVVSMIFEAYQVLKYYGCRYLFLWSVPEAKTFYIEKCFFEQTSFVDNGLLLLKFKLVDDPELFEY